MPSSWLQCHVAVIIIAVKYHSSIPPWGQKPHMQKLYAKHEARTLGSQARLQPRHITMLLVTRNKYTDKDLEYPKPPSSQIPPSTPTYFSPASCQGSPETSMAKFHIDVLGVMISSKPTMFTDNGPLHRRTGQQRQRPRELQRIQGTWIFSLFLRGEGVATHVCDINTCFELGEQVSFGQGTLRELVSTSSADMPALTMFTSLGEYQLRCSVRLSC